MKAGGGTPCSSMQSLTRTDVNTVIFVDAPGCQTCADDLLGEGDGSGRRGGLG